MLFIKALPTQESLHLFKYFHYKLGTVKLQWLEHLWNHENMFETGVVQAMSVNHSTRSGGKIGISFQFSLI